MTHVSTRPVALRMIVGAAAVIAALLAFVPAASAARDPISGGTTDLHLKKGFLKKLTNLGVGLAGVGTGSVNGAAIHLPVTEGMFDPVVAQGHVTSTGGFQLVRGARRAVISDVEANTVHGFLRAEISGAHMLLGTFANPTIGREGFGGTVKAGQFVLSQKAATRISNKLGLVGAKRIPARTMSNEFNLTVPQTVTIVPSGEATLELSAASVKKLNEKGVAPMQGINPIAPAKSPKGNVFTLPITGGVVAQDGSSGSVTTSGGVEILKKGKVFSPQMKITNVFVELTGRTATAEVELQPVPPFAGLAPRGSILEVQFPANAIVANPTTRQIAVKGGEGKLQPTTVATLNQAFNQGDEKAPPASSEFVTGETFGKFSMTLQAQ